MPLCVQGPEGQEGQEVDAAWQGQEDGAADEGEEVSGASQAVYAMSVRVRSCEWRERLVAALLSKEVLARASRASTVGDERASPLAAPQQRGRLINQSPFQYVWRLHKVVQNRGSKSYIDLGLLGLGLHERTLHQPPDPSQSRCSHDSPPPPVRTSPHASSCAPPPPRSSLRARHP